MIICLFELIATIILSVEFNNIPLRYLCVTFQFFLWMTGATKSELEYQQSLT